MAWSGGTERAGRAWLRWWARAALPWLLALAAVASAGEAPRLDTRLRLDALAEDAPTALALGRDGSVALGGARSVRVVDPDGRVETRLRRGPVLDLLHAPDGALWVATPQDLYRIAPDGEARSEAPSGRSDEPHARRLAAADGWLALATDQGVQLRDLDGIWRPLPGLSSGSVSLVAFRSRAARLELWSVQGGELSIAARNGAGTDAWQVVAREPLPLTDREQEPARDLVFDLPGADALLVFPGFLAVRDAAGEWRSLRPALPPGARIARLARAFGSLWLASDAGLLRADALGGPWRRAPQPLGSLPVLDLAAGDALWVASHRGLHRVAPASPAPATAAAPAASALARDPVREVARLHRAALRQQGLRPESMRALQRRIRLRGWWPELDVSFGYAWFRDGRRDWDQAFVSGDTRHLYDHQDDRGRDYDVSLSLTWDLGDAAFHPEELDALRESRSLIALRDDVLDEVTALYFERQQVLARLAASRDAAERLALALRAAELAAGLDAWTGGAFSESPATSLPAVPQGG